MLNIIAANATTNGFITVWPADQAMPNVSCLDYPTGVPAIANLVQVGIDNDGRVSVFTSGQAAVVVDLIAAYDDRADSLRYQAVEPVRLFDTRSGRGGWLGPTARDQAIDVPISDTEVVVEDMTVTAARRMGWLSTSPGTSVVNLSNQHPVSNVAVARPASDGRLAITQAGGGGEHVVFDLTGWFSAPVK